MRLFPGVSALPLIAFSGVEPGAADPPAAEPSLVGGAAAAGDPPTEGEPAPAGDPSIEGEQPIEEPAAEGEDEPPAPRTADSYAITLPEGFEINQESMDSFRGMAAEANLTDDAAQSLFDIHLAELTRLAERSDTAFRELNETWQREIREDAEVGGEKFEATRTAVSKALDLYGSPEARRAFDITGAGNNPSIFRFIAKMAQALQEGTPRQQGSPAPKRITNSREALYGQREE